MEPNNQNNPVRKIRNFRTNLLWILFIFLFNYILVSGILTIPFDALTVAIQDSISNGLFHILFNYTYTIISIVVLFLVTWYIRPNRYIWKSFLLPRKDTAGKADESDILADFYGRHRNSFKMLGWGLLLGFLGNGFAILCAWLHQDIKLYFDFSVKQIPLMLFAAVSVIIQSTSEELWCRGYLYERVHERYPLWISAAVNGLLFGLLHCLNEGATPLSILSIAICGISYSLLRWYTGSIWILMGCHAAWNFTQAFLFGLPNSGLVSAVSIFHLEASTGVTNLFYDFAFGVEGGVPALLVDLSLGLIILFLAYKKGRLGELFMNQPMAIEAANSSADRK